MILIGFLLCASICGAAINHDYIILDNHPVGFVMQNDQICDQADCYDLYFKPSLDFKVVLAGQRIPKGLHVTMDWKTGLKQAKILTEQGSTFEVVGMQDKDSDASAPGIQDDIVDIKIHDHESRMRDNQLTLQEKSSLEKMLDELKEDTEQTLISLADIAHDIDVGIGISNHVDTLMHYFQNSTTKALVLLVLGTCASNNPIAITKMTKYLPRMIGWMKDELEILVQKRYVFFFGAMLRENPDNLGYFIRHGGLVILHNYAQDPGVKPRVMNLINDVRHNFTPSEYGLACEIFKVAF